MLVERVKRRGLFFPLAGLFKLRRETDNRWAELVEYIDTLPITDPQVIAFRLTLDRLRRGQGKTRTTCRDRFCTVCTEELVADFKGTTDDLISMYYHNLDEVTFELKAMRARAHTLQAAA